MLLFKLPTHLGITSCSEAENELGASSHTTSGGNARTQTLYIDKKNVFTSVDLQLSEIWSSISLCLLVYYWFWIWLIMISPCVIS